MDRKLRNFESRVTGIPVVSESAIGNDNCSATCACLVEVHDRLSGFSSAKLRSVKTKMGVEQLLLGGRTNNLGSLPGHSAMISHYAIGGKIRAARLACWSDQQERDW